MFPSASLIHVMILETAAVMYCYVLLCVIFIVIINNHIVFSGPLDRGCQKLIFPACKNLGLYSHTLLSKSAQKKVYSLFYNKTYNEHDLEQGFPKRVEKGLVKYSKCRKNIEKLICGELFPPCFPEEANPVMKTLCRSVCDDIARDCPGYFR